MIHSPIVHRQSFDALRRLSAGAYSTVYSLDAIALKASSNLRMSMGLDGDVDEHTEEQANFGDTSKHVLQRSELIEAMILRRFSEEKHPNVLCGGQIFFDSFVGRKQFSQILQLDLANGGSLDKFLREKPLEFQNSKKRSSLLFDIANGLSALHKMFGVVHGDLKPGNILIRVDERDNWRAIIGDFSLATLPVYAVHGHAAEVYTFGYVAPECCDNFTQQPLLIRETKEASDALCSFSCFAAPVVCPETPNTPPSTPCIEQSVLYCDETLLTENCASPAVSQRNTISSTPDLITKSVFRPRQANSAFFDHVTKANFSSDIWAYGCIALFIISIGNNPVVDACLEIIRKNTIPTVDEFRYNFNHRMQMYFWYFALRRHQKSKDWQNVFDFEAVVNHFAVLFQQVTNSTETLKKIDLENMFGASQLEMDLVYLCMQFLPEQRLKVDELLKHQLFTSVDGENSPEAALRAGRKRRQTVSALVAPKKSREQAPQTLLSMAAARSYQLGISQEAVQMPFHKQVTKIMLEICAYFRFSFKSLLMANSYIHFSAHRIRAQTDSEEISKLQWTLKNCVAHAVTCLCLAVSLFEPRHESSIQISDVVEFFGGKYDFKLEDIAFVQRSLVEYIGFEFDTPTVANIIDLSLVATKTTFMMPSAQLVAKMQSLLLVSESLFMCSQAVPLALAFLKRFGCKDAFEHLLLVSGRHRSSVDVILSFIE